MANRHVGNDAQLWPCRVEKRGVNLGGEQRDGGFGSGHRGVHFVDRGWRVRRPGNDFARRSQQFEAWLGDATGDHDQGLAHVDSIHCFKPVRPSLISLTSMPE